MLICNYVYDKVGVKHKHVMQYRHAVPQNRVFDWNETRFKIGEYLLMHSVIYRTALLNKCGLNLPKHTFYVDELYVYQPLPMVKKITIWMKTCTTTSSGAKTSPCRRM